MRRLWPGRGGALRRLPGWAPADPRTDVRPVRGANRVAGVPLLRVCGAACRLRDRQSRGGLRRAHATARGGLEGTRAPLPDWRGRGPRRGSRAATARSRLAPVPADRDRTLWRGQGSAESLTEALAERWHLPCLPVLRRARRTPRQRGLDRAARRQNVREAFRSAGPVPARIGLVDDVYTTGATVLAATTELRRAGAREVRRRHVRTGDPSLRTRDSAID